MGEATTDLFLNLIQNCPIIYDKTLKDFKNVRKKEETWEYIAQQSRMSVDGAKKRYFSLRQKYCREKKNAELKRRYKVVHRSGWVFYDRMHFLDAFIRPRSTFTNDTEFVEDLDKTVEDGEFGDIVETQDINIDVDDNINVNELDRFLSDSNHVLIPTVSAPVVRVSDPDVHRSVTDPVEYQNVSDLVEDRNVSDSVEGQDQSYSDPVEGEDQIFGNPIEDESVKDPVINRGVLIKRVVSQYSGEISEIQHNSHPEENYLATPCTSSSQIHFSSQQIVPPLSVLTVSRSTQGTTSTTARRLSIDQQPSRGDLPAPKCTTTANVSKPTNVRKPINVNRSTNINKPSPKPNPPNIPSTQRSVPLRPAGATQATTSKEINVDLIRQKMDSCLTAIKSTKLPNVPLEIISRVEEEILELVKHYSRDE